MTIENPNSRIENPPSALYRAVWRVHFYAGIVVAPFAIFLAITGSIYLWKPQFEAWRYRDVLNVEPLFAFVPGGGRGPALSVSADVQLANALAANPGSRPVTFTPSFEAGKTSESVLRLPDGTTLSVFVDPHLGRVVGSRRESERLMTQMHDLHGELFAGKRGKLVVELVASWALMLFLTGIYLWWPRPQFTVWGFLLPRLRARGRTFWRDVHAVPAVWLSLATVFMLSTGLLWTDVAGGWYRRISAALGQGSPRETNAGVHRSELTGWSPPLKGGLAAQIDGLASSAVGEGAKGTNETERTRANGTITSTPPPPEWCGALNREEGAPPPISLTLVMSIAAERGVLQRYTIALPVGPTGVFSVLSDRNQPFNRTYLHLDQYSGSVLADVRFRDLGYLAQFFGWGIIAHEGQLFGLANQILGTVAASGVVLLATSGLIMWWKRRPAGKLGAPERAGSLPRPVVIGTVLLACLLPMLAASLVVVGVLDWVSLRLRPSGRAT